MDNTDAPILDFSNPIGYELPALISLVGVLLWLFTKRTYIPISWALLVFFAIAPYLARTSMATYTGNTPLQEFLIRWAVYGGIFAGITWAFSRLYISNTSGAYREGAGDSDSYSQYEDWGDKTYSINNRFFVKAWEELEKNMVDKGIWAKALSASDGDENKAQAIYIRLRVKELASESQGI